MTMMIRRRRDIEAAAYVQSLVGSERYTQLLTTGPFDKDAMSVSRDSPLTSPLLFQ
jgi:hypothetical protein